MNRQTDKQHGVDTPARSASEGARRFPRLRFGLVWLPVIFLLTLSVFATPARALDDEQAVQAGREGLSKSVDFPWYDESEDDVRSVEVSPPPDPPQAGDWEAKKRQPKKRKTSRRGSSSSSSVWEVFLEILMYLAYGVLIAVGVGLILVLVRAFLHSEAAAGRTESEVTEGTDEDVDRVEALPFQVRRPQGNLLAEARRHYEAGNFNEAIVYYYSHLLVELDKGQLIRLTRGKTNRQYLREVRPQPLLFEVLQLTMIAFEDVFFGHHQLLRDRFERCFLRLTEFESRVQEAVA